MLASAAYLPRHRLPQSPVLAQGLLLHPGGASPLGGDSHNSIVVMALPKLVLAQRLAANTTENPEKRGSAWLRLLQGFCDQPICLITRQGCDAADNVRHLREMPNTT